MPPEVSIIIVNTNDDVTIRSCLQSIEIIEKNLSREIIIVDNGSINDLSAELSAAYASVSYIRLPKNCGFSKANNIGIRKAKGKFILLLNPDTILTETAISKSIKFLQSHWQERIGAVGCRLLNQNREVQKSFFFSAANIYRTIQANALYIASFKNKIKKNWEKQEEQLHSCVSKVPWLCGAFLLINREALMPENLFLDENFFLYSDDVELGNRIRRSKYALIYYPETSIIHLGSGGKNPWHNHFNQLIFSDWLCMMKIHGRFYFILNQCLLLLNYGIDQLLFYKTTLFGKCRYCELKSFLMRKKIMKLWRAYTLKILFLPKRPQIDHEFRQHPDQTIQGSLLLYSSDQ
jgi:GT2 family glycosyltransferase